MKKFILCFLLFTSTGFAQDLGADALVKTITEDVLATLRQSKDAGNTRRAADLVESKVLPHFDFIRMIMENDRDGNYGRAISRNLAEIKIDLKISDDDFINEMGQTMFDSLPQKAKGKYNLKVI